jgi:hypothetical protein
MTSTPVDIDYAGLWSSTSSVTHIVRRIQSQMVTHPPRPISRRSEHSFCLPKGQRGITRQGSYRLRQQLEVDLNRVFEMFGFRKWKGRVQASTARSLLPNRVSRQQMRPFLIRMRVTENDALGYQPGHEAGGE